MTKGTDHVKTYAVKVRTATEPLLLRAVTMTVHSGRMEFRDEHENLIKEFDRSDVEGWWEVPNESQRPTPPADPE